MAEQLYRIEIHPNGDTNWVPYVPVRDLGWACGEMIRHPMKEYKCEECEAVNRWNPDDGDFEYKWPRDREWRRFGFTDDEITSTSWHAVESVENTAPGTLAWARETVKAGGAVWITGFPLLKYDSEGFELDDETYKHPPTEWEREAGWHLWGDRDWLTALPDGTRVRHESMAMGTIWQKIGTQLYRILPGGAMAEGSLIEYAADSGWDLDREQAVKARTISPELAAKAKEFFEPLDDVVQVRQQLAELERRVRELEAGR